ncbi:zinc-dependent metalloprotease [Georgenia sp. 10Sc9-8]|uniref:Zinc-dependent metalloprotease n=1 Tax=Georgenia halotolerans TaxID=3028317 RepID=A0ABT5TY14_9MICO|nr:zinc-dependent metalloprotease [Georgenia halotolerans]
MSSSVNWQAAVRRASAVAPPGPRASPAVLRGLVSVLRESAERAPEHVGAITGLRTAAQHAAQRPVYVVDRPRWAQANVELFQHLTGDLLPPARALGSARVAGEEMGIMLGLLSTKVLGQFDPFTPPRGGEQPGRLVLVAPNVLRVERELNLDAMDFRLWVCLHEQTHAVQFAAAPWLVEHLTERLRVLVTGVAEESGLTERLTRGARAVVDALRGGDADSLRTGGPLVDAVLTEPERELMTETIAVMSLLEGHADVVMDEVGPALLPSVRRIRASFERRRDGTNALDVVLRRLLGMDAKVAQYRTGAAFVRGVVAQVGHEGLNAVWTSSDMLPSADEIADPRAWVRRVHG